ncbi:MAG: methylenetetrahydrofolate reductase [NAD(P)H] [Deltaproteobacteria bacterium]|nr:methylenetetrahydrofolate reductase [NAD(P)H] [Deltaproteobacteria bacterium]MBW2445115.1 methylenetetrahydrofolate reductase [NAD(P)H] [Deltaproteobacteria bacterium]
MRVADCFGPDRPVISFEFSPPKTDKGFESLYRTVRELKRLEPAYVSVTYGAGGSTRRKTVDIVSRIQREIGITAMAHLTCVCAQEDELASLLDRLEREGIENVLALSGDPPRDQPDHDRSEDAFQFASQLTEFIRSRWDFCLAGGCYPETHPTAASPEADLASLKAKVDAGADVLVSQLFFDNASYFGFVDRARAAGIEVPIVPGIMPVVSTANIRRIAALCESQIPEDLDRELSRVEGDGARTLEVGIEWATMQCRELLAGGAPGIHFYTLNRSPATRRIHASLFGSP